MYESYFIDEADEFEYVDDSHIIDTNFNVNSMKPSTKWSAEAIKKFNHLIEQNKNSFATKLEHLGSCKGVKMHIETTSEMIIHNTPYRQPPAIEEEMNKEVQEMLEAGLIRKGSAGTSYYVKQKGKR